MSSGTWRGIVGVVKPTYGSGSLVEFIRLLPEGVGCIPMYAGIKEHSERGYLGALETYNTKVAELAEIGVDLMHPEGGPPFMVRGYKAEQEIVAGGRPSTKFRSSLPASRRPKRCARWESKSSLAALILTIEKLNSLFARYFTDAGLKCSGWKAWIRRRMKQTRSQRTRSTSISNPHSTNTQRHKEFTCSARAHGR